MNNLPDVKGAEIGFSSSKALTTEDVGSAAAISREQSEIQSAIIIAQKFPRNENDCFFKAMESFKRPSLAEAATYRFPRGKTEISGPSIDCARELARCWKHLRHGIRIVKVTKDMVHIKGYAYDCENNNYVEAEDEFAKLVQRKSWENGQSVTKWVQPDERDLRELINRRGAILVRNSILQLLPPDLIEQAQSQAEDTRTKAARNELADNREDTIRKIAAAFFTFGVTTELLEKKLGHSLNIISPVELTELRKIFNGIREGLTQAHEHFEIAKPVEPGNPMNDKLKEKADKVKAENAAKKEEGKDAV